MNDPIATGLRDALDGHYREIREEFRTLHQRPGADRLHGRAFHFVETDADESSDAPEEQADHLAFLAETLKDRSLWAAYGVGADEEAAA